MNKVMLVGRMVVDPEVREGEVAVVRFRVAVQRNFKDKNGEYGTDFISCVAFRKTAEFVGKYFGKGKWISLTGEIRTGSYEKDGEKKYTTDVVVSEVNFVGDKGSVEPKEDPVDDFDEMFEGVPVSVPW